MRNDSRIVLMAKKNYYNPLQFYCPFQKKKEYLFR